MNIKRRKFLISILLYAFFTMMMPVEASKRPKLLKKVGKYQVSYVLSCPEKLLNPLKPTKGDQNNKLSWLQPYNLPVAKPVPAIIPAKTYTENKTKQRYSYCVWGAISIAGLLFTIHHSPSVKAEKKYKYRPYNCSDKYLFEQQAKDAIDDARTLERTYCHGNLDKYKAKEIQKVKDAATGSIWNFKYEEIEKRDRKNRLDDARFSELKRTCEQTIKDCQKDTKWLLNLPQHIKELPDKYVKKKKKSICVM